MNIKRLKSLFGGMAIATVLAFGAGATPALADHGTYNQYKQGQSRHYQGHRQPRYWNNRHGWQYRQRHDDRYYGNNRREYNRRFGQGNKRYGNRHRNYNRNYNRSYNRYYGNRRHYRY